MASSAFDVRAATLAVALGACLASPAAVAEALFLPPAPTLSDDPAEFGTGWYLRGDVGYANISSPRIIADLLNSNLRTSSVSGGLGAGYRYDSWLRAEIAIDRSVIRPNAVGAPVWCPYANHPLTSADGVTRLGYGVDPNETCVPRTTANSSRTTGLFNAYVDLGDWFGVTPYVGAGVGLSYVRSNGADNYYRMSDGTPYAADLSPVDGFPLMWVDRSTGAALVPQPAVAFAQQYWDRSLSKASWKFAWSLLAGFSYDIGSNLKVDLGYRYLNSGKYVGLPSFSGASAPSTNLVSHEVRLGVRVTTD